MAIIQLNGIISNIKGSIGGITFSNVRSGIAAKRRLPGKKTLTSKQLIALNNNKRAVRSWTSLTFGQKNAWNAFAALNDFTNRFGQTVTLTGFNWFNSINLTRLQLGQAMVLTPPSYEVPAALPSFFITMTTTSITVEWAEPIDTGELTILAFASVPGRSQAQYNRGAYRILDVSGEDVSESFDVTEAWEAATGLNYATVAAGGLFTLNMLIVPVALSSYITGVGVTDSSQIPFDGVGYWSVSGSFEVS